MFNSKLVLLLPFIISDFGVVVSKSVDYGRMAEILVQRAGAEDAFTRQTAITWVCFLTEGKMIFLHISYGESDAFIILELLYILNIPV